jgi:hypothetical protein
MLALLLASSGAWAEWVKVTETEGSVFYIDPATIRNEGNVRKVWVLQDLKQRHKDGDLSTRMRYEYDCKGDRFRMLSLSSHTGQMARGQTLVNDNEPDAWYDVPPKTITEFVLKLVCAN